MAIDFVELKTEIQTDPSGIGYASEVTTGNDVAVAALLNEVRVLAPTFTINRGPVSSQLVVNEFDPTEFGALVTTQLLQVSILTQFGMVDLGDASVRQILGSIFPVSGPTRTALTALSIRPCSRAEFLFGLAVVITQADVAKALRG